MAVRGELGRTVSALETRVDAIQAAVLERRRQYPALRDSADSVSHLASLSFGGGGAGGAAAGGQLPRAYENLVFGELASSDAGGCGLLAAQRRAPAASCRRLLLAAAAAAAATGASTRAQPCHPSAHAGDLGPAGPPLHLSGDLTPLSVYSNAAYERHDRGGVPGTASGTQAGASHGPPGSPGAVLLGSPVQQQASPSRLRQASLPLPLPQLNLQSRLAHASEQAGPAAEAGGAADEAGAGARVLPSPGSSGYVALDSPQGPSRRQPASQQLQEERQQPLLGLSVSGSFDGDLPGLGGSEAGGQLPPSGGAVRDDAFGVAVSVSPNKWLNAESSSEEAGGQLWPQPPASGVSMSPNTWLNAESSSEEAGGQLWQQPAAAAGAEGGQGAASASVSSSGSPVQEPLLPVGRQGSDPADPDLWAQGASASASRAASLASNSGTEPLLPAGSSGASSCSSLAGGGAAAGGGGLAEEGGEQLALPPWAAALAAGGLRGSMAANLRASDVYDLQGSDADSDLLAATPAAGAPSRRRSPPLFDSPSLSAFDAAAAAGRARSTTPEVQSALETAPGRARVQHGGPGPVAEGREGAGPVAYPAADEAAAGGSAEGLWPADWEEGLFPVLRLRGGSGMEPEGAAGQLHARLPLEEEEELSGDGGRTRCLWMLRLGPGGGGGWGWIAWLVLAAGSALQPGSAEQHAKTCTEAGLQLP